MFCWKNVNSFCTAKATHIFFSKNIQHICESLDVNFKESLIYDVVSFEQLDPGWAGKEHRFRNDSNQYIKALRVLIGAGA